MSKLKQVLFLSIIFLLGSCSSIEVTSDYDKSIDFSKFTTYSYHGWAKDSDKILNPFDKARIESAFKDEFAKRGLTLVKEDGELVVALFIVTQEKTEQVANTTNMGGYAGWLLWLWSWLGLGRTNDGNIGNNHKQLQLHSRNFSL